MTEPEAEPEPAPEPEENAADLRGQPLRVSTLELFFDLVFVFAVTQLTSSLAHHDVTAEDGFRVLLVFGVLWWMYGGYVWLSTARTPSQAPERLLMLVGMAGFLIMAPAIPGAFGRDGVALGIGYLIVILVHGWLYQRVNANIARVVPFNLAAAALVIGTGAEGHPVTVALVLSAVLGLALSAALWWAYFGAADDERAERAMTAADPAARPALARAAYFYAYIPLLLGVVAMAAGVKQAIQETGRTLPAGPCWALGCGVALFLAGSAARHGAADTVEA